VAAAALCNVKSLRDQDGGTDRITNGADTCAVVISEGEGRLAIELPAASRAREGSRISRSVAR